MKKTKHIWLVLGICLIVALAWNPSAAAQRAVEADESLIWDAPEGCTVILVGKAASTDGSVMSTHTCDCGVCDWTFRYIPGGEYKAGEGRRIYHVSQYVTWPPAEGLKWERIKQDYIGLDIPQPERSYAYIHGMFGYMNENQVAIGESTIGAPRKLVNSTPSAKIDLTTLTQLGMERAKTARDCIRIMGSLAEEYGYGFHDDGEMLAVSDPNEIWIFEIMPVGPLWTPESSQPGAVWCAQRVPDDHVSVCPNESRIGEIDLDNSDYFMGSSNIVSFAIEKNLFDPESGEPFNWKKAYSPTGFSANSSGGTRARMWRFFDLAAPSQKFSADMPNMDFPFSVKPDKKLSAQDVMNLTRDKFQGTKFDPAEGLRGGPFKNPNYHPRPVRLDGESYYTPRTIGVNRAEYTTVTQCRDWLPDPIGGIVWLSFGAQDTACYMPLYIGITEIPHSFQIGDHWEFNRDSARWAFDYVDFHTLVVYSHAIEDVKKAQAKWEARTIETIPAIDTFAKQLYDKNPEEAIEYLTEFCNNNANLVVNAWWKLGDELLVKYRGLSLYDSKTRKRSNLPYPEDWLREVVRYHNLPKQPPRKK